MPYVSDRHYRHLFEDLQAFSPNTEESPAKKKTMTMRTKMISVCFLRKSYEVRLWFRLASRQRFQLQIETKNSFPSLHPLIHFTGHPSVRTFRYSNLANFTGLKICHVIRIIVFCGPLISHVDQFGLFIQCHRELDRAVQHLQFLAQLVINRMCTKIYILKQCQIQRL